MVTESKFHTESPQFWSDLRSSRSPDTLCSVHVTWYTFLYTRKIWQKYQVAPHKIS